MNSGRSIYLSINLCIYIYIYIKLLLIMIIITWTRLRKGNFNSKRESLLLAAQKNAKRNKHIHARIDKTQQNSKCTLCADRDETTNHIISECSKLAQKAYKTRQDRVSKVIHREMCKKFEFDHTNKWYMRNPAFVQGNDPHKLLWDFDI